MALYCDDNLGECSPNVYIGDILAAQDTDRLAHLGIRYVVDMANMPDEHPRPAGETSPVYLVEMPDPQSDAVISKLMVRIDDVEGADLASLFRPICEYIRTCSADAGVLVHCFEGKSRSVAAAVAFLMMVPPHNHINIVQHEVV